MSEARLEAERLLEKMDQEQKRESLRALLDVRSCESKNEFSHIMSKLSPAAAEFVAVMSLAQIENSFIEDKKEKLKQNDDLIRKDAATFLAAMLSAGASAAEDDRMIQRAITLAKKLHEYC